MEDAADIQSHSKRFVTSAAIYAFWSQMAILFLQSLCVYIVLMILLPINFFLTILGYFLPHSFVLVVIYLIDEQLHLCIGSLVSVFFFLHLLKLS